MVVYDTQTLLLFVACLILGVMAYSAVRWKWPWSEKWTPAVWTVAIAPLVLLSMTGVHGPLQVAGNGVFGGVALSEWARPRVSAWWQRLARSWSGARRLDRTRPHTLTTTPRTETRSSTPSSGGSRSGSPRSTTAKSAADSIAQRPDGGAPLRPTTSGRPPLRR